MQCVDDVVVHYLLSMQFIFRQYISFTKKKCTINIEPSFLIWLSLDLNALFIKYAFGVFHLFNLEITSHLHF